MAAGRQQEIVAALGIMKNQKSAVFDAGQEKTLSCRAGEGLREAIGFLHLFFHLLPSLCSPTRMPVATLPLGC